jgi:hypothetical protein
MPRIILLVHNRSNPSKPRTTVSASVERNCGTIFRNAGVRNDIAQLRDPAHELQPADLVLPVVPNVV